MTRLPVTTTSDDSLGGKLAVSGGLHFLLLAFIIFGLPHFMKPLPTPYIPVPIEIVDVSDITNTRIKEQQEEPPKPPEAQPKPEEQKTVQQFQPPTPPTPPQPETKPQEAQKSEAVMPMPKPAEKPEPPKPAAKPQADMLASVLKNVQKMKPAEKAPDVKTPTKAQSQAQPKSMAPSLSDRLTVSEEDALRRQIEQCWNPPIGARDAKNLVVEVNIIVNADRSVQNAEVVDKSRANSDPYFRAAAEAAIRALFNPRCSPLELPEGKYDQWKNIDFTFDPRDML